MADCISHLCTKCIRHFDCQLILSFSEKSCQFKSIWLTDTNTYGISIYKHFRCFIGIAQIKPNTSFYILLGCSFITHGSGFVFISCSAADQIQLFCRNCFYEFWIGATVCKCYFPFFRKQICSVFHSIICTK